MHQNLPPIHYKTQPKDLFYSTLRTRVDDYFRQNNLSKMGNPALHLKSLLLLTLYIGAWSFILRGQFITLSYAIMGFLTVPIFLNIGHEAIHSTFSERRILNQIGTWVFNFVGVDARVWHYRHIHAHHAFTNVFGYDLDIAQTPIVRIAKTAPYRTIHRWQYLYIPVLYLVYTMNWLLLRDFKDYHQLFSGQKNNQKGWIVLILTKLFYLSYTLFLPIYCHSDQKTTIIVSFLLMQVVMSITTFLILVSTHVGEDAIFPEPSDNNQFDHTWAEHQLITTTDFAPDSPLITHFCGGFNHHVAHHLLPNISHCHYPQLTPIVRATAQDFGLTYNQFPSLRNTIASHFKLLKNNSQPNFSTHLADI